MQQCEQTKGLSVLEHGLSVYEYLQQLFEFFEDKNSLSDWKIPSWLIEYKTQLQSKLLSFEILKTYTIYHDCGKPFCRTVDENGNVHFPDHAEHSYRVWLEINGDKQVAKLMRHDMWIHLIKANQLEQFIKHPEAISWLLVGLCEVHANAEMFGGINSTSFKIKWKQIDKRGRAICKMLFKEIGND